MAIKVEDAILGIRSRLGDTDYKNRRYNEAEIIDAINSSLAYLSEELLCFRREWIFDTKENIQKYELPHDFLRLIFLSINDTKIEDIRSEEIAYNNKDALSFPFAVITMQTIELFLGKKIEANQRVYLRYNHYETISNKEETIPLPNSAKEALIYGALALLYENPIKRDGLNISNRYLMLRDNAIKSVKNRLFANKNSKSIRVNYIKV